MDPVLIEALVSMGLKQWADYQDRAAKGTITDADVTAMLDSLGTQLTAFQSAIDAHKAAGQKLV
jgi:hypothetical protein